MSTMKTKLLSIIDSSNRKILLIELKLELRKIQKQIKNLKISHHLKKFYLVFFICACLIPLFSIKPTATSDSKFLKLIKDFQLSENKEVVFAEPINYIPTLTETSKSSDFFVYKLKTSETQDTLLSRFSFINKSTLSINNPGKEFKEGSDIIIPNKNGYLFGYNKDTNFDEMAKALNKDANDLKKLSQTSQEGFVFVNGEDPEKIKKDFDIAIIKLRTPAVVEKKITFAKANTSNNNNGSVQVNSSIESSDLSGQLSAFISSTKGVNQHDGNGWSYGQCVSLVKRWQQYIGARSGFWPGNYPAPAYYTFLGGNSSMAPNSPSFRVVVVSDVNSLKAGDVLITTGYPSHTGIATGGIGKGTFDIYDQNSPVGSGPRFNTYPKSMFIGALRYIKN
jgi:hypothetical protein